MNLKPIPFAQEIALPWFVAFLCLPMLLLNGCRTIAPIQVWKPPISIPAPPDRVAMAPIAGDREVADRLQQAMLGNRTIASQQIALLDPSTLERTTAVRLTSYEGEPSDIGSLSAARRAETQILLEAEILQMDLSERKPLRKKKPRPESMTVRWRLIDVASGTKLSQHTISMDRVQAEKTYPDLEFTGGSGSERVIQAVARESWGIMAPHLEKEKVRLANAWITPGAISIRKGNALAKKGKWNQAEEQWQNAVSAHPHSKAAWHNLAVAAVAKEDFELARRRMEHAQSWIPIVPVQESTLWLEKQQKSYHASFQLPPPEGGWTFPDPPAALPSSAVPSTQPKDIDEQPWWTVFPFAKPPGWTWSSWLSQPVPL